MSPEIRALLARQPALRQAQDRLHTRPRRRPKQQERRVRALYQSADLFCPELVSCDMQSTFDALSQEAWARPLDDWKGEGALNGLLKHLLVTVRYPLAGFLYRPLTEARRWWWGQRAPTSIQLLAHLGRGGSTREAVMRGLLPRSMTRRMQHRLLTLQEPMPLLLAIRTAQLDVLGAAPWMAAELMHSRLGPLGSPEEEQGKLGMLAWLADISEGLPQERLRGVVDWLLAKEPPARRAALRLNAPKAIAASADWHRARLPLSSRVSGPLPLSVFKALKLQRAESTWEVTQLVQGHQLVSEGEELQHCVATYYRSVMARRSEIFSLRRDGRRRLTVEVRPDERAVVQARGLRNRVPLPEERLVLQRFAAHNELVVRSV